MQPEVPGGSTIPASAHNCRHASHPTVDALIVDEPSPTEDRKRQKKQEKERKMNGETVKKKKKQIVEQVFDDCDGDFTPLFADVPFDSEVPE